MKHFSLCNLIIDFRPLLFSLRPFSVSHIFRLSDDFNQSKCVLSHAQPMWGRAGLWHGPTMGWCGHLGPQPNGPMAPTGPPELACNSWGQLGAPLVAQAWLWGWPTPPLWPNSMGPTACGTQWPCHTNGHGPGLCTWVVHITHNV